MGSKEDGHGLELNHHVDWTNQEWVRIQGTIFKLIWHSCNLRLVSKEFIVLKNILIWDDGIRLQIKKISMELSKSRIRE